MTFYPVVEWPHISILDPRTGEQLVTWSNIPDSATFCELVTDFLTSNPPLNGESNKAGPDEPVQKRTKTVSVPT